MSTSSTSSPDINPSTVGGLICRQPIARNIENLGLRHALDTSSHCRRFSQGLYCKSPSSCKCKCVFRARRSRGFVDFPARIGDQDFSHHGGRGRLPSPSPAHRTTLPKKNGYHLGPSVELITCKPESSKGVLSESSSSSGLSVIAQDHSVGSSKYVHLLSKERRAADSLRSSPLRHAVPPWELSLPHVAVATLASVLFGYHVGVVNVPLQYIAEDLGFAGSVMSQGLLVSLLLGGAFVGCAASGMIADGLGRCLAFQLSSLPMILGAALCAMSSTLKMMLTGRFLVGIGLGLSGPLASLYVSEISPTAVRGAYGSLLQVAGCCGILGALVAGFPSSSIPGWWRVCFWIAMGPAILLAIAMHFCAESPRWLFKKQQYDKAELSLQRLWGSMHVKEAMSDLLMKEQLEYSRHHSWCDLFDRQYSKVVLIGAALFAFQQLAGINVVFYFSSTVFRKAGITSDVYASICVGVANLFASLIATFLMDRQGRRPLLIISFSGMAVAMAIQASAAAFSMLAPFQGTLAVIATLMYVVMFALGAGPVPSLLLPELFADGIRAKAMAIAMCIHWIVNFVVGLTFLQLLHKFGAAAVYSFFAVVCVVAAIFVSQVIFETRGKTLDEIQALLLAES